MNYHLYRQLKAKYDRRNHNDEALRVYYGALVGTKTKEIDLIKEIERREQNGK